jgi:hypothetical protein
MHLARWALEVRGRQQIGKILEEGAVERLALDQQREVEGAIVLNICTRASDWLLARRVCLGGDQVGEMLERLQMLIGETSRNARKDF